MFLTATCCNQIKIATHLVIR